MEVQAAAPWVSFTGKSPLLLIANMHALVLFVSADVLSSADSLTTTPIKVASMSALCDCDYCVCIFSFLFFSLCILFFTVLYIERRWR